MSVSSVGSTVSVGFRGEAVSLEVGLDQCVRDLQKHLNMVQVHLRQIASICEQDADFKVEVSESDKLDDELREMCWLFADLRQFAEDLISIPDTPEDKIWYKAHKAQRKLDDKRIEAEHAAKVKDEKKANKLAMKMANSSIAEGDHEMKCD